MFANISDVKQDDCRWEEIHSTSIEYLYNLYFLRNVSCFCCVVHIQKRKKIFANFPWQTILNSIVDVYTEAKPTLIVAHEKNA